MSWLCTGAWWFPCVAGDVQVFFGCSALYFALSIYRFLQNKTVVRGGWPSLNQTRLTVLLQLVVLTELLGTQAQAWHDVLPEKGASTQRYSDTSLTCVLPHHCAQQWNWMRVTHIFVNLPVQTCSKWARKQKQLPQPKKTISKSCASSRSSWAERCSNTEDRAEHFRKGRVAAARVAAATPSCRRKSHQGHGEPNVAWYGSGRGLQGVS